MSKKGRREPRLILFSVARTAINCNPLIKEIYEKHVKRGMSKMAALGCVMHKILRI
ncbi:MAG: IS110 family transposase, partial [Melioribacteraceae bacterium]|nr:IS110 family transposase [Melioribacteraceae bacterium]